MVYLFGSLLTNGNLRRVAENATPATAPMAPITAVMPLLALIKPNSFILDISG